MAKPIDSAGVGGICWRSTLGSLCEHELGLQVERRDRVLKTWDASKLTKELGRGIGGLV